MKKRYLCLALLPQFVSAPTGAKLPLLLLCPTRAAIGEKDGLMGAIGKHIVPLAGKVRHQPTVCLQPPRLTKAARDLGEPKRVFAGMNACRARARRPLAAVR